MPAPKEDAARARAVVLGRTMGVRGVAEQLGREGFTVGKTACADWLRADKAARAGNGRPVKTAAPRPVAKPAKTKAPAATTPSPRKAGVPDDVEEDLDEASLSALAPEALDFAELVKVDRQVTKFLLEAYKQREERRYAVLVRIKLEVRTALNKLRPAPTVDPMTDPANLEARKAVVGRLQKMIAKAQAIVAQRTTS